MAINRSAVGFFFFLAIIAGVGLTLSNNKASTANTTQAVTLADNAPICAPRKDNPQRLILPIGAQVVDFELGDLDGTPVQLGKLLANGPVLLEFFATWCPHCQHSVDALHHLHDDGVVQVIGVNSGEKPGQPSTARTFKVEYDIPYPILDKPASTLLDNYCLQGFPLFYLLDTTGTVIWHHTGTLNKEKGLPELNKAIAKL